MKSHTTSPAGPDRPRRRRARGVLIGAVLCVTPLALAPAASADSNPLGAIEVVLANTVSSLPNTVANPVGGGGPGEPDFPAFCDTSLIVPLVSCIVDALDELLGGQNATAVKQKATMKAKAKASRKASRVRRSR